MQRCIEVNTNGVSLVKMKAEGSGDEGRRISIMNRPSRVHTMVRPGDSCSSNLSDLSATQVNTSLTINSKRDYSRVSHLSSSMATKLSHLREIVCIRAVQ